MPKGNKMEVEGVVVEILPNACFNIRITAPDFPPNFIVRGYISGKMRMHYIKIIQGDRVTVEIDPLDITKGRITFRHKAVNPNAPTAPRPGFQHPQRRAA